MQKWEYKVEFVEIPASLIGVQIALCKLGERGWELVHTQPHGNGLMVILKKPGGKV